MGIVIVGGGEFEVRKFLIREAKASVQIVVGTKSLADKLTNCEVCDELIETTNFYVKDELIGLPAQELCRKHLGKEINLIKEIF